MRSDDDPPRCLRILGRNDIGERLDPVRGLVPERILFYVPFQLLQCINDIIPDSSVVRGVHCLVADMGYYGRDGLQISNILTRSGYQDLG